MTMGKNTAIILWNGLSGRKNSSSTLMVSMFALTTWMR